MYQKEFTKGCLDSLLALVAVRTSWRLAGSEEAPVAWHRPRPLATMTRNQRERSQLLLIQWQRTPACSKNTLPPWSSLTEHRLPNHFARLSRACSTLTVCTPATMLKRKEGQQARHHGCDSKTSGRSFELQLLDLSCRLWPCTTQQLSTPTIENSNSDSFCGHFVFRLCPAKDVSLSGSLAVDRRSMQQTFDCNLLLRWRNMGASFQTRIGYSVITALVELDNICYICHMLLSTCSTF
jgi:hypothetical protein